MSLVSHKRHEVNISCFFFYSRSLSCWWPAPCIWSSPPVCCLTVSQGWLFLDQCVLWCLWCSCCLVCCWLISDQSPPSACCAPWHTSWSGDWIGDASGLCWQSSKRVHAVSWPASAHTLAVVIICSHLHPCDDVAAAAGYAVCSQLLPTDVTGCLICFICQVSWKMEFWIIICVHIDMNSHLFPLQFNAVAGRTTFYLDITLHVI